MSEIPTWKRLGTLLQHCYNTGKVLDGRKLTCRSFGLGAVDEWLPTGCSKPQAVVRDTRTGSLLYTPDSPLALGLGPEAFWGWKQKETVSRNGCRVVFEFTNFKTVSPVTASPEAVLRRVLNRQGIRISLILQILTKFYTK